MMSAEYFEYYTIIFRGGGVFPWTHCILCFVEQKPLQILNPTFLSEFILSCRLFGVHF